MIHGCLRVVVVGLVTRNAGRAGQVVVVVHVALHAWRCSVEARQRPTRRRVIELAVRPQNRVMAVRACCWIVQGNVINRSLGVVVIRLMAGHASRICQLVVVVDVAQRARRRRMKTRQGPTGRRVIELAIRPQHGVMTAFARRRETQRHMVNRRLRVVVVRLMACDAGRIRKLVVVVDVAQRARRSGMESG